MAQQQQVKSRQQQQAGSKKPVPGIRGYVNKPEPEKPTAQPERSQEPARQPETTPEPARQQREPEPEQTRPVREKPAYLTVDGWEKFGAGLKRLLTTGAVDGKAQGQEVGMVIRVPCGIIGLLLWVKSSMLTSEYISYPDPWLKWGIIGVGSICELMMWYRIGNRAFRIFCFSIAMLSIYFNADQLHIISGDKWLIGMRLLQHMSVGFALSFIPEPFITIAHRGRLP